MIIPAVYTLYGQEGMAASTELDVRVSAKGFCLYGTNR